MGLELDIRQRLAQAVYPEGREPAEDVPKVREGLEAEAIASGGQGAEHRRRPAAAIAHALTSNCG
jgi:hypothetical protein